MSAAGGGRDFDLPVDPAYPTHSPADPLFPCQTLLPLAALLDGVATPAMWSRLGGALERAAAELWSALSLLDRGRPTRWVSLHYGRIALNAHGWERMRSAALDLEPDAALVRPPEGALERIQQLYERLVRARLGRGRLAERMEDAAERGRRALARAHAADPRELATLELARGPLDEPSWSALLFPSLGARLREGASEAADHAVRAGIELELRHSAEAGRRLARAGALREPAEVAYLTVAERIRAAQEGSDLWARLAASRRERVDRFLDLELPSVFWGRPRDERSCERDAAFESGDDEKADVAAS
jgi:hypothetical protein